MNSLNQSKDFSDVSVIVSVYNAEHLNDCLDSIISQTLENIEIICIDECSTNSSNQILKEYEEKDERIIILENNENCEDSFTYNKALDIANGEYVCFVNSNDWIEVNNLEYTFYIAEENNLDLILYKSEIYDEEIQCSKKTDKTSFSALNEFEYSIFNYKDINPFTLYLILSNIESKLYSRNLIETNHIKFREDNPSDNMLFFNECFLKSDRITLLDKYLYNFRITNESDLDQNRLDTKSEIRSFDGLLNILLNNNDFYDKFHESLYNYIMRNFEKHLKNLAIDYVIGYYDNFKEFVTKLIVEYDLYEDIEDSLEYNHLESFNLLLKSIDNNEKQISDAKEITKINPTVSIIVNSLNKSCDEIRKIFKSILLQDIGFQFLEIYFIDNNSDVTNMLKEFSETFYNVHISNFNENYQKHVYLDLIKNISTDHIIFINETIEQSFIQRLYDKKQVNSLISCLPSKDIYEYYEKTCDDFKDSITSLENKLFETSYIENEDFLIEDDNGNIILSSEVYSNSLFSEENIIEFLNSELEYYSIEDYDIIIDILRNNFYNKNPTYKVRAFNNIKSFFKRLIQVEEYDKISSTLSKNNSEFFDITLMSINDDDPYIKSIQNQIKLDIPVSIIVYLKDNPTNELNNLIHSIIRQNFGFPHIEIVLLNNKSEDLNTIMKLEELDKTYYNTKIVNIEDELNIADAYNFGIDSSDKQYFMFTNKEHILLNTAIKNMFKAIRNGNMNLATGYVQIDKTKLPEDNIYTKIIKHEFIDENNIRFTYEDETVIVDPKVHDLKGLVKVDIPVIKR